MKDKAKSVPPSKKFGATPKKLESDKAPMGRKGDGKARAKRLEGKKL